MKLKPWNKRWFVLCDDGKLYYYKAPEDAKQAKVPSATRHTRTAARTRTPHTRTRTPHGHGHGHAHAHAHARAHSQTLRHRCQWI